MKITKKVDKLITYTVTDKIICNGCGKEAQRDEIYYADITPIELSFGFGSKKDGDTWKIDLCDDCVDEVFGKLQIKPEIYKG